MIDWKKENALKLEVWIIQDKKRSKKKETVPDWLGKEYADEQEIDTETNDALKKRLENLKNKRPKKINNKKAVV